MITLNRLMRAKYEYLLRLAKYLELRVLPSDNHAKLARVIFQRLQYLEWRPAGCY